MDLSKRIAGLSPEKRALLERVRRQPVRAQAAEPIAIVGMGCRFPGGASNPDAFWQLLRDGADATTPVPDGRWDTPGAPRGGFLTEPVDRFDAAFFGISRREAEAMDPQHRLLLEVAWEALENAGQAPGRLTGSLSGVFVGIGIDDYKTLQTADPMAVDAYTSTGNLFCAAAGRISHLLGLTGPSMAVDTGCSSSLVAVHLAMRSLRLGECDLALAAGVHLMLSPEITLSLTRAGVLSPEGRCRTFDAGADGYARGEGCGVVVLKRLSDAIESGDEVLAVIRGSAVNHDGPSAGLTVPNGQSQQKLIRAALADAGTVPAEVGYLEAHGTGTPLGDPIEVRAFGAVLGEGRETPLLAGSVKTGIGHLEAAAGVAGLIKVVLALRHEEIPASLNFTRPSPHIPWPELPVRIPVDRTPWPRAGQPRVAGISSFGIGGTNAHLVVAEAPAAPEIEETAGPQVLALSARGATALTELAAQYEARLAGEPAWAGVVRTANTGRDHFEHRLAVVAASSAEAARLVTDAAAGQAVAGGPRIAFLFTGQGSQYAGMGRALYRSQPVFRQAVDDLALTEVLFSDDLDDTANAQRAIFAIQHGLTELWASWGVRPAMVLGHSVGEYAAACAAGVLRPQDAARIVAERGRLMAALPRTGAMAAVFTDRVEHALAGHDELSVAAYNGPKETVISGAVDQVAAAVGILAAEGVRSKTLNVSHAFHSPLMRSVLDPLAATIAGTTLRRARCPIYSTVTGQQDDLAQPEYWLRNVSEPVRFAAALRAMLDDGCDAVVEIGPQPVLIGLARRAGMTGGNLPWLATLNKNPDDSTQPLHALAKLYTLGADIDWTKVQQGPRPRLVSLPTYPFQRRRYWRDTRGRSPERNGDSLPGNRLRSPAIRDIVFQKRYDSSTPAHLPDHLLFDTVVVPGASHLALLLAAEPDRGPREAREIVFPQTLVLADGHQRDVQIVVRPSGEFQVASVPAGDEHADWTTHASGVVADGPTLEPVQVNEILDRCTAQVSGEQLRQRMSQAGYGLGPSFHWLGTIHHRDGEVLARLVRPEGVEAGGLPHPGLIDSCFQAAITLLPDSVIGDEELFVPVRIDRFTYVGGSDASWLHIVRQSTDGLVVDLTVLDAQEQPVFAMTGVQLRRVSRAALLGEPGAGELQAIRWDAEPLPAKPSSRRKRWLVYADAEEVARELVDRLAETGDCTLVLEPGLPPGPWDGVVGLWTQTPEPASDALRLVQAVAELDHEPRLWLVTRGARAVLRGDIVEPGHAPVWGLGKVAAAELPRLRCTVVDLDSGAESLLPELLADDEATGPIAYRAGNRYVARTAVLPARQPARPELRADGTYLVTGGLGGIGLHVAGYLADRGARHIALLSRGEPSTAAERVLAQLEGVRLVRADVTDRESLQVLRDLTPSIRGVVHAAGILDDGALLGQDAARLRQVAAAKVDGARNLRDLLPDVDFFLLFSSVAATRGTLGQAAYAAANAHLDALAEQWQSATSIGWGAWADTGMARRLTDEDLDRLAEQGIGTLTPHDALLLLDRVLTEDVPAHVLAVRPPTRRKRPEREWESRPEVLGRYTPPGTVAEKALADLWEEEFRIRPIGAEDDFFALGGDSMVALGIAARARRHGLLLKEADFFRHATVRALAQAGSQVTRPQLGTSGDAAAPELSAASRELLRRRFSGGPTESADQLRLAARLASAVRRTTDASGEGSA